MLKTLSRSIKTSSLMKPINAVGLAATILVAAAQTGLADDSLPMTNANSTNDLISVRQAHHSDTRLFRAHELSMDVFGTLSFGQETLNHFSGINVRHDSQAGAGGGLNYFITRHLGFGGDFYSENTTGKFVDNASGNFILRFPCDRLHLAPYVYGGAGYQFETSERAFGQAGAGVEFRVCEHCGLFLDGRYVFPDGPQNFGLGRAGLRFSF